MYLGVVIMCYCWRMTHHFPKLDEIFERITICDDEIAKLLGNNEKIRKAQHVQFRFEFICMGAITISYVLTSIYDIIFMYPP